jgi:uncharacterized damage-inducible protein DinB
VTEPIGIRPFYAGWDVYNERITRVIGAMTDEQLAIRPSPDGWPIWATVAHTAGVRVYWLCAVCGEPGAETTPFTETSSGIGWEDDLDHPRSGAELVQAMDSTWRIVDGVLEQWTVDMLEQPFKAIFGDRMHTRQSLLMRLISHDAYHAGELSQTLGIAGLRQIDLWAEVPDPEGSRQAPGS